MKTNRLTRRALLCAIALVPALAQALPPDTTEPMGQSFAEPKPAKSLRVAIVGSGSSHDFPKYFLGTDSETLKAAGDIDVAATPNLAEALKLMEQADVLVFSGNHNQYGSDEFQKALNKFADDGKGLVFVHAATWAHPWKGYNDRFIGGRTPSHGYGEFKVTVTDKKAAITKDVPEFFDITDENYRFQLNKRAKVDVCCENAADQTDGPIPSVWVVKDRKAKIVCITLGHAEEAHNNPAYKQLLTNAVKWVGGK
ncbi:ThuA domain-containing protein [Luteolibacter marinus]|uniref:ThuA domain-containing protein n=1 Tax=Luteolibacter marinus TaxID=2776705 RepID=UPI0018662235|nr:ThuA domain-containing protein [Luteolibacter marinus]